jgi:RNA polymerase-binding transcription factor DksA
MTAERLAEYRKALTDLAATVERGLAHDQRELMHMEDPDLPGGPLPVTDEVLDSGTQEVEAGLASTRERLLAEVKEALARMDAGTYGRCAGCGKPIAAARLAAVPYARRCVRCAEVAEAVS